MSKTIVICGYGPGISAAVAERFGREGFQVALVARSEQRLAAGVAELEASGTRAAAVRADLSNEAHVLPDLEQAKDGALLVTNGGFGLNDPIMDKRAVAFGAMGLGLANAAKRKLVGMLVHKLKPHGVYVGEVMVQGSVKGSAWDNGTATLEAATVADAFYDLYSKRSDSSRNVR